MLPEPDFDSVLVAVEEGLLSFSVHFDLGFFFLFFFNDELVFGATALIFDKLILFVNSILAFPRFFFNSIIAFLRLFFGCIWEYQARTGYLFTFDRLDYHSVS